MIRLDGIEQGTPEWFQARIGIPTASRFDEIITSKGDLSKQRQKYLYELAGESITKTSEASYYGKYMQQGNEREPEARDYLIAFHDLDIEETGLCYYDERKDRGCSPDGLIVDKSEGLEIKCPKLSTHVEYLLEGKLPTKYFVQVQGSLYITGFDRWHFVSYYPDMDPLHIVVERDEIWIAKLDKALNDFTADLKEIISKLK